MALSEHAIQSCYFQWARLDPVAKRAYAIPNAAKRSPRLAAYMKAEGMRAGVLDVCLPVPRGGCGALYIEFKADHGKLTEDQKTETELLAADGNCVLICWGAIPAIEMTARYIRGELAPGVTDLRPVKTPSRRSKPAS